MPPFQVPLPTRLARNQSGAIAIQFGLISSVLFGLVGAGVDYSRWHRAARTTQGALDAAVLAGARTMQLDPQNPQAALDVAQAYFQNNAVNKVAYSVNTISFVFTDNNTALTAQGTAKISTFLLRVVGFDELTLVTDAGSGFPKGSIINTGSGGSNLEISLMLDVTGSMCDNEVGPCTSSVKLNGLKTAANRLIDTVISDDQGEYFSKMSIVPFSTRVRLAADGQGGGMMKAVTDLDPVWNGWYKECIQGSGSGGSEGSGNWQCLQYSTQQKAGWKVMPCVTDRFYNNGNVMDVTDLAPGSGRWLNAHGGDRMAKAWDSSSTAATTSTGQSQQDPAEHWNYNSGGICADVANANAITPLSSDKSALKARINGLEAYGATAGALGTAWSWYTISPRWSSVFTGQSRPGDYTEMTRIQDNGRPALRKVAILMTDGVFNTWRGWKGQNQQSVSNYAKQICTNMKAEGIEIFTIGLALDELPAGEKAIAEDTLRNCGTDISHFYSTLNVEQLQTAFQQIGFQLSTIRLTR